MSHAGSIRPSRWRLLLHLTGVLEHSYLRGGMEGLRSHGGGATDPSSTPIDGDLRDVLQTLIQWIA